MKHTKPARQQPAASPSLLADDTHPRLRTLIHRRVAGQRGRRLRRLGGEG